MHGYPDMPPGDHPMPPPPHEYGVEGGLPPPPPPPDVTPGYPSPPGFHPSGGVEPTSTPPPPMSLSSSTEATAAVWKIIDPLARRSGSKKMNVESWVFSFSSLYLYGQEILRAHVYCCHLNTGKKLPLKNEAEEKINIFIALAWCGLCAAAVRFVVQDHTWAQEISGQKGGSNLRKIV